MEANAIREIFNSTWHTPFLDQQGAQAMSLTYPVPEPVLSEHQITTRDLPGHLETHLNYPCMQIYLTTPDSFLFDRQSQETACEAIAELTHALSLSKFFTNFSGIRFEVYDSRPAFATKAGHKYIAKHSIREREARNTPVSASSTHIVPFNAPILPTSFYSPPSHRFHGIVLISTDVARLTEDLQFMYFNKEVHSEKITRWLAARPGLFVRGLRSVSICREVEERKGKDSFVYVLSCHLGTAGFGGEGVVSKTMRDSGFAAVKLWFGDEVSESTSGRLRNEETVMEEARIFEPGEVEEDAMVLY